MSLVAKVTGQIQEQENAHHVEGFVAVNADGSYVGGEREFGILFVKSEAYLKRVARPDATIRPATLTIHSQVSS